MFNSYVTNYQRVYIYMFIWILTLDEINMKFNSLLYNILYI